MDRYRAPQNRRGERCIRLTGLVYMNPGGNMQVAATGLSCDLPVQRPDAYEEEWGGDLSVRPSPMLTSLAKEPRACTSVVGGAQGPGEGCTL